MSQQEFDKLINGEMLRNDTDHKAEGKHTDSIGFCFFVEEPDDAIHWLRGIVSTEQCVTFDIPGQMITASRGEYRDPDRDPYTPDMGFIAAMTLPCPMMTKQEYCLREYSLQKVRLIRATDKYAPPRIVIEPDPSVWACDKMPSKEDMERIMRKYGMYVEENDNNNNIKQQ